MANFSDAAKGLFIKTSLHINTGKISNLARKIDFFAFFFDCGDKYLINKPLLLRLIDV